ncbi:MAG: apolipoprotein N-acyltransferase [Pseudomonadota bacterium]
MSVSQSNSPAPLSEVVTRLSPLGLGGLCAVLGGLAGLGHPPLSWPQLTVLSLVALFAARPWALGAARAALIGWAYGVGYFAVSLHWIVEPFLVDVARHGWMAPFAISLMAGGLALFWGAAFALAARWPSAPFLALTWALAEFARSHLFGGFPWAMIPHAFIDHAAYQAAAFLGPHGLTLALLLAASLCGLAFRAHWARLGGVALLIAALVPGPQESPRAPDQTGDAPLVRVVQPNAEQDLKWREDMIPVFFERKLAATAAAPKVDLVLWPEVALPTWLETGDALFEQAAARAQGAQLLIGAQRREGGAAFNSLAQIDAAGRLTDIYDKFHLVPFGEYMPLGALFSRLGIYGLAANEGFGFAAGGGPAILQVPGIGAVQPLICFESIFARHILRGDARPRVLAVLTNDAWFGQWGGPEQHLDQARARAIEFGLPVVRSANTGISAIIDAQGRVTASLALGEAGHVDAALPAARPPTLFARFGEALFAVAALFALAASFAVSRFEFD